ncbi:MAG TPA: nitroreductase family protein [Streptosporangiaceae bacterium]|nr:nitroreductase family protein [Streptosporangiaceae bacterium]
MADPATAQETASQILHRLTSYDGGWYCKHRSLPDADWMPPVSDPRVLADFRTDDETRFPWFYKRFGEPLPRVPLPRGLRPTDVPAVAVLGGTASVARADLDLPGLSRLLYLCAGVVRTMQRPARTWLFRAAGSAGGRFPLELYVAVPEGSRLAEGVHWYDPWEHALVRIGPAPAAGVPAVIVTGVPWRTGWRYRERGFRHIYWDAGTALAQLLAAAGSAGIGARLYSAFPDEQVTALVGADGVHEFPVAVVALGEGSPAIEPGGQAVAGLVDAAPVEFPLVTAAQRAGAQDALGAAWEAGAPVVTPAQSGAPVEEVVRRRGSQRRMDPARALSGSLLRTCMQAATRGIDLPHFVAVHHVEGFGPGLYRWPALSAPVRAGDLRDELCWVCMDQALGRDAAFVVISAADVAQLSDLRYREAQLAAGLVEGRLHLLAYALGAGASGMTFLDSEIPALLGEPLDGLLFTCVGVPAYASAPGGLPGAPTAVGRVVPVIGSVEPDSGE